MSLANLNIGQKVENYEVSEAFDAYGRIDVVLGEDEEGNVVTVSYPNVPDDQVSGRVMTVQMPMCTSTTLARTAAQRIYNSLTSKDPTAFQYQPMIATGALADPSIEFGDSVDINGTHSGFYTRSTNFNRLMRTDLSSPTDEEIDHVYPYEDAKQRQITRTNKEMKSGFYVTNQAITAEVSRATQAEGTLSSRITVNANSITSEVTRAKSSENTLSSRITQNASSITAEVSRATTAEGTKLNHTRSNSTFGWKLTADSFTINKSGSQNVFTANKDGIIIQGNATVTGKIQATSGYIGSSSNGFTINSSYISNGKTSRTDSRDGVYIGRDGIALGASNAFSVTRLGAVTAKNLTITGGSINLGNGVFRVNSSGGVTAKNMSLQGGSISLKNSDNVTVFSVSSTGRVEARDMILSGTLKVGSSTITADNFRLGAERANSGYSNWNSAYNSTSEGGYCYGGANAGYNWDTTKDEGRTTRPSVYVGYLHSTGSLSCNGSLSCGGVTINGMSLSTGATRVASISVSKNARGYVTDVDVTYSYNNVTASSNW